MKKRYLVFFIMSLLTASLSAQWTPMGITQGLGNPAIESIEGFVYHNGQLYSNTFLKGIQVSSDMGDTWSDLNENGLNHHPRALYSYQGKMYAACNINGLVAGMWYYSDDDGANWVLDTAGMPESAITAGYKANFARVEFAGDYMIAELGVPLDPYYRRHLDSTEWHSIPEIYNQGVGALHVHNDTIWAGGLFKLFYSVDFGKTWTNYNHGIPSFGPSLIHKVGSVMHIAGDGGFGNPDKLMRSTDNWVTWTDVTSLTPYLGNSWLGVPTVIRGMYINGNDIYISSDNDSTQTNADLVYSSDYGVTWAEDTVGFGRDPNGTTVIDRFVVANGYLMAVANFRDVYKKGLSVGLKDLELTEVRVYPNPSSDYVQVDIQESIEKVFAVSMNGQQIELKELGNGRIDIQELVPGTYLLYIQTDEATRSAQIVVK